VSAAFRDPAVEPTAARIHAALGAAAQAWDLLTQLIGDLGLSLAWRYYRDGGWLARASKGSRTVAWVNVHEGSATVTCYFAERDRARLVDHADLPTDVRDRIAVVSLVGKLLPVSLQVHGIADLAAVATLLRTKLGA
jgi:Protein of unknown function (DUF3788)